MATGDIKWFAQGLEDLMRARHDVVGNDIRLGIVVAAAAPSVSSPLPHWGGTGTTNFATSQVATGTVYTGPIALANKSISLSATGPILRGDVITLAQDASGFTNGAYAIIYNNTDPNKRALGYVELNAGGTVSLATGPLNIDWLGATNDVLRLTQS